jgi:hypothetical protein
VREVVAAFVELLSARDESLEVLIAEAGRFRDEGLGRAGRPRAVTYSPKVFVPVTTLCRDRCQLLHVRRYPGQARHQGPASVSLRGAGARDRAPGRSVGRQEGPIHPRRSTRGPLGLGA